MLVLDPDREARRVKRLHALGILDTGNDSLLQTFAEEALCLMPGTNIAAVTLVDTDRQWFKTIVGIDIKETPRSHSFCAHTIETSGTMVVEDAACDERFANNPLVTTSPGIRFYAGVCLTSGIGALCVIGRKSRQATETEILKLTKLAHCVDIQLLAHGTIHNLER